ncbi:MAG TPA: hypothetical protein VFW92_07735 [Candidatus Limnocylindrales bacterium]|nr:hypothetical protein [Candidatus Limnocylindrales bacterium]
MTPTTPTPPALIFGAHIAALGALRILVEHGVRCYVVDDTPNIITRSRWYRRPKTTLVESPDSATLDAYLQELPFEHAVLVACSDQWALAVSGLPEATRERFPTSLCSHEVIEQLVDKDRFRALAERLDLPRPRSRVIRDLDDLAQASDEELDGGFLKPTESHRHNRTFGTKGFFIESREAAQRLVETARAAGITFMLQEWIPGDMSSTILFDGFVDREGTTKAIVARRRVRMNPPRLANTASDVTIPLSEVESCLPIVRRLLAELDFRGVFNIEFKYDARDRTFKIIELNPRPFWLTSHIARAGADLPWMSYRDALGLTVPEMGPYRIGRFGMYEIPDGAAILRAWSRGSRPEGPVLRPWLTGDRALFWWRDPLPAVADVTHILGRRVNRWLGRS